MSQIFGDFIEQSPNEGEYLIIGFSPSSIPLKQRWRNNGLSADFMADYLQTFFVGEKENDSFSLINIKGTVKYVANELLENAMKFSDGGVQFPTRISFHLQDDKLLFYVINSIREEDLAGFQDFLSSKILSDDPYEAYIRQMEDNATKQSKCSRLGFLSMICDYSAKLGWKFEVLPTNPPINIVTTVVCLEI